MIHCLLDEYRFYHQYPEKQLNIISTLFGQIINNKLIDGVIETIALKYILEGIKKGNGPLFIFGTKALEQFLDKLNTLPTYIHSLVETKQLRNDPILYEAVFDKYSSMFVNDPATNINTGQTQGLNNDLNNLINPQNMIPSSNIMKNVNVNGLNQNNNIPNIQQLKNKMFSGEGGPNQPGIFENDLSVNQLSIKNNQRPMNPNDNNNFNQMLFNMQNNKNATGGDQFYGVNNPNINSNINLNPQLLQPGIGQNINNLINNSISKINMNTNNTPMEANPLFMNNNLNPIPNIQNNAQNNLNTSLENIQNPNNQLNNNILNNPNNLSLNDSLQNIDDQSPQKRPKLRREPSGNKNTNNIMTNGSNNNLNNINNDFTGNMNIPINNNPIKNISGNNNNYGFGELFGNEMEHKM